MLTSPTQKKSIFQKQIPTLVGLLLLVGGLVGGIALIGSGTGVFAPRATPETTPENVRVSNVTDTSFTISFLTQAKVVGFVKYGTEANRLSTQASDDRDQLTGTVGQYQTHHITVRGLQPGTEYYYVLGTGSNTTFDNEGSPFAIRTTQRGTAPSAAKNAYGTINNESGTAADGAIVYASLPNVGEMSSLVKSNGSWVIPLSNARLADGSGFATVQDTDSLQLLVQGVTANLTSQAALTVEQAQPVPTITLGQNLASDSIPDGSDAAAMQNETNTLGSTANETDEFVTDAFSNAADVDSSGDTATAFNDTTPLPDTNPSVAQSTGSLDTLTTDETDLHDNGVIDLGVETGQIVPTGNPLLKGTAKPNVPLKIVVNSDTQIIRELVTGSNGEFELDIAALSEELEPGEHTATYSYIDPETNQEVSKTVNFTVAEPSARQLAQAQTNQNQPYSSANPVPVATATPSPSPTPIATGSATASQSATATASAVATGSGTATRSGMPATDSAIPVSGSVGTTFALILGGLFFITAGAWSFWLAHELDQQV